MAAPVDLPRSLEPTQIALPRQLARGALIGLPAPRPKKQKDAAPAAGYEILRFQYNPETVTRSRTGQWERKLDKKAAPSPQEKVADDSTRGGALKSKSEIISFKLVFDAAELMMRGGDPAPGVGILPELSVLERFALGPDQMPEPKKDNEFALISLTPTEAILVLGPRKFPGVITQVNIVEQRFNPDLVPIRAEVDVRFRVLETAAVAVDKDTAKIFDELMTQRRQMAQDPANGFTANSLDAAVAKAVALRAGA